jgi:L-methionine (R)-S-oxide reductase
MEALSFSEILTSGEDRAKKAKLAAEKIRLAGKYAWVGLYDVKEKEISIISYGGKTEPAFTSFPKDKGLNGRAVTRKQTVVVNDIEKDEDYLLTFCKTKSEMIVPVYDASHQTIVGTIDVEGENKDVFSEKDVQFLEDCAKKIGALWTGN